MKPGYNESAIEEAGFKGYNGDFVAYSYFLGSSRYFNTGILTLVLLHWYFYTGTFTLALAGTLTLASDILDFDLCWICAGIRN